MPEHKWKFERGRRTPEASPGAQDLRNTFGSEHGADSVPRHYQSHRTAVQTSTNAFPTSVALADLAYPQSAEKVRPRALRCQGDPTTRNVNSFLQPVQEPQSRNLQN